jgi:hypothetical protein
VNKYELLQWARLSAAAIFVWPVMEVEIVAAIITIIMIIIILLLLLLL